jgi:Carboxypeptidase regulatory-like domain
MKVAKIVSSQLRRTVPYIGILLVALFQVLPATPAQDSVSIAGSVQDAVGDSIEAATVHLRNLETGAERTVRTNEVGRFHAHALPVGSYEIVVDKPGFRFERRSGVALAVGYDQEVDFALQVGDLHQVVEVSADPDVLLATTEDTSGLVGERQVKDLPLNGRSYDQLLTLNPGTVITPRSALAAPARLTRSSAICFLCPAIGHRTTSFC